MDNTRDYSAKELKELSQATPINDQGEYDKYLTRDYYAEREPAEANIW